MPGPIVTDHALVRFLERAGGMDVERLRGELSAALARVNEAVTEIGGGNYRVSTAELRFVVKGQRLVTVLPRKGHR